MEATVSVDTSMQARIAMDIHSSRHTAANLGVDFLQHFGVLVNMKQCQLIDTLTNFKLQGIFSVKHSPTLS